MAILKIPKRENGLTVLFFQICVVANNVFGSDAQLYVLSKILTLAFFCVVLLRILHKGTLQLNQILLLPLLFTAYCAATAFWAYDPDLVISQMITQIQLLVLLFFTFWAMNDGVTVLDYLRAVYVSGLGLAILALVRYGGVEQYTDAMLSGERMGGEIANQNTFGIVFGNAALSTVYYFLMQKKRIHILSFALFVLFAFSSGSRKAMLMILAGVIVISVLHYGIRRIYRTLILAAVVLVGAIFLLQTPVFGVLAQRLTAMLNGEQTASDRTRQSMIEYGLELFRERPLHGFGLDNFRALYIGRAYSHNNYIELLSSGGIIALVLYYLMFMLPAGGLLLSRRKGEKLPAMHLMLLVWLAVELVFGVALVQFHHKNSWILAGMLMAEAAHAAARKRARLEGKYEADR